MAKSFPYKKLSELEDKDIFVRIKVRLIRFWEVFSSKNERDFIGIDMILLDEEV